MRAQLPQGAVKNLLMDRWSGVIIRGGGGEALAEIISVGRQLEAFPEDYPLPPICARRRSFYAGKAVSALSRWSLRPELRLRVPSDLASVANNVPLFLGGGKNAAGAFAGVLPGVQNPPCTGGDTHGFVSGFPWEISRREVGLGRDLVISGFLRLAWGIFKRVW